MARPGPPYSCMKAKKRRIYLPGDSDEDEGAVAAPPAAEADEADFMSETFTAAPAAPTKKRKAAVAATARTHAGGHDRAPKLDARMQAARAEGLESSLGASNKGHKLLRLMGWDGGSGLGKDSKGIRVPIDVISAGRHGATAAAPPLPQHQHQHQHQQQHQHQHQGLGQVSEERRTRAAQLAAGQAVAHEARQGFVVRAREAYRARRVAAHLRSARAACQGLDEQVGLPRSRLWPPLPRAAAAAAAAAGALICTVCAARAEHCKCERDRGREEGSAAAGTAAGAAAAAAAAAANEEEQSAADALARVCAYLRETHCHCVFCGASFDDGEELAASCPGPADEDHE